ncbi:MAG: ATP-dependent metallopeptidase FtsH/Yme1/Tma family protein, partial [Christensenella sp.]
MAKFFKGPLIYIIIIVVIILAAQFLGGSQAPKVEELQYTELLQKVQDENIKDIAIQDRTLVGRYKGTAIADDAFPAKQFDFKTTIPTIQQFNLDMAAIKGTDNPEQYGFVLNYVPTPEPNFFMQLLPYLIPIVLLLVLWFVIMKRAQGGAAGTGGAMEFGKSKARMTDGGETHKTFDDVAGADEEKEELQEVVEFLKN